jgi:hypothetical protein
MPETIAWQEMPIIRSLTHLESSQSFHYYSWLTSMLTLLFSEQQRLDNGINSSHGSGALGLRPSKMEPGQMAVSAYIVWKAWINTQ